MKFRISPRAARLVVALWIGTSTAYWSTALAQGTAFTYQGQLQNNGSPATGTYNFIFTLYDTNVPPGNIVGGPVTNSGVTITNPGFFTATIDFGNAFNGSARWLEIAVSTPSGPLTTLSPRQQVTPSPYALYAGNATMLANGTALGDGIDNLIAPNVAIDSFIGGGSNNVVYSTDAVITGGYGNQIGDGMTGSVIGGGVKNAVSGSGVNSVVAGGILNSALGAASTVGGGSNNFAAAPFATVAGGDNNRATAIESTVGGGTFNTASGQDATVGGGFTNTASGSGSFIGGGGYDGSLFEGNSVQANAASVVGGLNNMISPGGQYGFIGGGQDNVASGLAAVVLGGGENSAGGQYATVAGGIFNNASGSASLAAGSGAVVPNDYSFLWADGEGSFTSDTTSLDHQFKIQASAGVVMDVSHSIGLNPAALYVNSGSTNGVGLYVVQTNSTDACIVINSCASRSEATGGGDIIKGFGWSSPPDFTFPNTLVFEVTVLGDVYGHSFNSTSDRNAKEHFAAISPAEILQKVTSLPVSQWNFKGDHSDVEHIGPMAQDFHAAFGLNGTDDKRISLTDEGGVALAAIQGLNQKLEADNHQKDSEIQNLKQQNDSLAQRLNELEQAVSKLATEQ